MIRFVYVENAVLSHQLNVKDTFLKHLHEFPNNYKHI